MWQYIFFFKPETNRGQFKLYFENFEKKLQGSHHSEISKTNKKPHPQGYQGCQKTGKMKGSIAWHFFALVFIPNGKNFEKLSQNNYFWQIFLFLLGFLKFVQFGLDISAKTHQHILRCAILVLLTPLATLGAGPYRFGFFLAKLPCMEPDVRKSWLVSCHQARKSGESYYSFSSLVCTQAPFFVEKTMSYVILGKTGYAVF